MMAVKKSTVISGLITWIFVLGAQCCFPVQAKDVAKNEASQSKDKETLNKHKTVEPLDEMFLLFLAELEEVEGELLHPIDAEETVKDVMTENSKKVTKVIKDEQ